MKIIKINKFKKIQNICTLSIFREKTFKNKIKKKKKKINEDFFKLTANKIKLRIIENKKNHYN